MRQDRHSLYGQSGGEEGDGLFGGALVMTSHYYDRAVSSRDPGDLPNPAAHDFAYGHSRYADRPMDWHMRLGGITGTTLVVLAVLGCALFTWRAAPPMLAPAAPLVVQLLPLSAPPEPVQEVPEGPQQVEQQAQAG